MSTLTPHDFLPCTYAACREMESHCDVKGCNQPPSAEIHNLSPAITTSCADERMYGAFTPLAQKRSEGNIPSSEPAIDSGEIKMQKGNEEDGTVASSAAIPKDKEITNAK